MNNFEKLIIFLQSEMVEPKPFGWFHLLCLLISSLIILYLFVIRKTHNEKRLKIIFGIYGIVALILELAKQIIWSCTINLDLMAHSWSYPTYIFPFQLCTTPIYVCLLCLFLKKNKLRDCLGSYLVFITIWGSIMTMLIPDSCFVETVLVNIHTMYLHCGSFVVSMYLIISKEIEVNFSNMLKGFVVFTIMVLIALLMNLTIYPILPSGETFNMFYISPYFESVLPIFVDVQKMVPYPIYLLFYLFAFWIGSFLILGISVLFKKRIK